MKILLSVKTSKVHQSKSVTNLIILNTNWNKIIFANIDGTLNFNKFLKWHWFYVHLSKFSTNFEFLANIPVRDSKRTISTKRVEGGHETEEFSLKFSRKKQSWLFGGIRKNFSHQDLLLPEYLTWDGKHSLSLIWIISAYCSMNIRLSTCFPL